MKIRPSIVSLLAVCAALAMSPVLAGSNPDATVDHEIKTAAEHAGYAAQAQNLAHVHKHLHHVMNCLVGPKGGAFDASAGNPCKGEGNGMLNDDGHMSHESRRYLREAVTDASYGLNTKHYQTAVEAAGMAKRALKYAKDEQ